MIPRVAGKYQGKTAVAVPNPAQITGIVEVSMVAVCRLLSINGEAA